MIVDNTPTKCKPNKFNLDDLDDELAQIELSEREKPKTYSTFKLSPISLSIVYKNLDHIYRLDNKSKSIPTILENKISPINELRSHFEQLFSQNKLQDTKKCNIILDTLNKQLSEFLSNEKTKTENPLDSFFNNNAFFNDKRKSSKFSIEELNKLKKLTFLNNPDFDIGNIISYKLIQIPKDIYNIYKPLHLFISESLSSITLLTTKIKKSFMKVSSIFNEELDKETKIILLKILLNNFLNIANSKIKMHSEYSYAFGYFIILLFDIFEKIIEVLDNRTNKQQEYYKLMFSAYVCGYELKKIEYEEFKAYFLKIVRELIENNDVKCLNDCLNGMGYITRKSNEIELDKIIEEINNKLNGWKNDREKEFYAKKLGMNIEKYRTKEWPSNEYKLYIKVNERVNIRFQTVYDGDYN